MVAEAPPPTPAASILIAADRMLAADGTLDPGWLLVDGAVIAAVGSGPPPAALRARAAPEIRVDLLAPGLIDLHVHGGGGASMAGPAGDLARAVEFHREHGTTATLVSLVADRVEELCAQLDRVAAAAEDDPGVLGAHLEGPFLSAARCGAQNPASLLAPSLDVARRLLDAARGRLVSLTIAPELPGALAVIDLLLEAGVVVAVGHSDASYEQARAAFDRGASVATHLFNGMPPLHHRAPGPVGAALAADVYRELINDGVHTHPSIAGVVNAVYPDRLVLITDAISAAGSPDGEYELGGQAVHVGDGQARLASNGALAGSVLTLDAAVRHSIAESGIPPAQALRAASANPAAAIGRSADLGALRPGRRADVLGLDADLMPALVISAGRLVPGPGSA